jgi:hypothetical protein
MATEQQVRDALTELADRAPLVARVRRPVVREPNRRWTLVSVGVIALAAVVVAGVVFVTVHRSDRGDTNHAGLDGGAPATSQTHDPGSLYTQPELAAAKAIVGVQFKSEPQHTHTEGLVTYDTSPPTGGDHSPIWALCDGVVYNHQIANENAVHMLEHGAIWITYNPKTISRADLTVLERDVNGVNYLALSPYEGLKTPISLQAWGYQLFVTSANDPRIDQFVNALKFPSSNTPEPGAGCVGSGFIASESYPGHPYNG